MLGASGNTLPSSDVCANVGSLYAKGVNIDERLQVRILKRVRDRVLPKELVKLCVGEVDPIGGFVSWPSWRTLPTAS